MNTVINFIFTRTALGRYMDGKKKLIGASLLVLAAVIEVLGKLSVLFPETVWLTLGHAELSSFYKAAVDTLTTVGLTTLAAGEIHAQAKAKLAEESPPAKK